MAEPNNKVVLDSLRGVRRTLDHKCKACGGDQYWFWWETKKREVYQCANEDCNVLFIEELREEIVI